MLLALNPSLRASGLFPEVVTFDCPQRKPRCRQRTNSFRVQFSTSSSADYTSPLGPRQAHTYIVHTRAALVIYTSHSFARYTLRRPCDPPFSQLQLYCGTQVQSGTVPSYFTLSELRNQKTAVVPKYLHASGLFSPLPRRCTDTA